MGFFDRFKKQPQINKFNEAFFYGAKYTENDDTDLTKYIDLAYNINPDVYSIVTQRANKLVSVPYGVKEIEDKQSEKKLNKLLGSTKYDLTHSQRLKALELELKAYNSDDFEMPIDRPNTNQSWDEFFNLTEIFMALTGNVYWYCVAPEDGPNAGQPSEIYVLPSHLIEIVLKDNANLLSAENPVDYYILTEYNRYTKFKEQNVVHISTNNPNFGFNGEHLYGQSPLRASWKNIEASNKGLNLNINTLKNGGVFGLISSKSAQPFTHNQSLEFKERLKEMNSNPEDLSRIAAISTEIAFTKLSLSADELKPFEYLKYNQKQICNVLGWSTALLNNDEGGKYDKQKEERKRVVTDTTLPSIKLYESVFNEKILSRFKGYDNKCLQFNIKEIPELQADLKELTEWTTKLLETGTINRNTQQILLGLPISDDPNMLIYTVKDDIMTLEDAILPQDNLDA